MTKNKSGNKDKTQLDIEIKLKKIYANMLLAMNKTLILKMSKIVQNEK